MSHSERIETTLGDLIVVLTEEARRFVNSERETYKFVALLLTHLLSDADSVSYPRHSRRNAYSLYVK